MKAGPILWPMLVPKQVQRFNSFRSKCRPSIRCSTEADFAVGVFTEVMMPHWRQSGKMSRGQGLPWDVSFYMFRWCY
jgi:hypothetical protein